MLTQKELKEILSYNPCTGLFKYRAPNHGVQPGKPAGSVTRDNCGICRRRMTINYKKYLASRLAWLYSYGEWPKIIDHVDGDSTNDSLWNLVSGTYKDNMRNPVSVARAKSAALARHARDREQRALSLRS